MVSNKFPYRLRSCVWELTLACCFSCKYCGSRGGKARSNELTTEECFDVAAQLADLGCERVSLIGGEVFMRSDWELVTRRLVGLGVRVAVITNGFFFSDELVCRLRSAGVESVAVSLDAPKTVHDKYRQEGSFERAARALDVLSGVSFPLSIVTTLNGENVRYLEEMYKLVASRWSLGAWQLQACSPMGNAAQSGIDHQFDPQDVIAFVERHASEAPFSLGIADNIGYFTSSEGSLRGNTSGFAFFRGCRAGLSSVGIDSVGNVRGCESMYDDRFIEGNVRERSLRDIWESPTSFAYNRQFNPSMLTGACAACAYGEICAGGCRSYNYFVHGRLYEYPRCAGVRLTR